MNEPPLTWETHLPLFTRAMFRQWTGAMAATLMVVMLILVPIFASQGEWDALPPLMGMVLAGTGVLWALGFLIMALVFRGRLRVRYTLTGRGVVQETIDRTAKGANRLAILAGALGRSPQVLGSGLIAKSREREAVEWAMIARADDDPARHFITLRNSWRSLLWVQCTPENHALVLGRIRAALAANPAGGEAGRPSPLPRYLGLSLLTVLACVPLFLLVEEFDLDLLVALLVLCFALATLWLIPLFGWVVLAGLGWLGLGLVLRLTEVRPSTLFPGRSYRGLDLLTDQDLGLLLMAALGAAFLVWLSLAALRGRLASMLVRDQA